ncbi:endo-1,4-beta-xylanase [Acidipila sp. 4G-K13]|uniref:Beta-xylanase n=2 Tax=Paracidobacterium acidisoli TaxID=2303751 RepID=A0A372IL10_9BACT|nr:endo-1,4-beta-xylanase [Paracidobacterium acidisoli]
MLSAATAALAAAPAAFGLQRRPQPPSSGSEEYTGSHALRAHAEARGLLVGCAVVPEKLSSEPAYANVVASQCNLLVPENAMKWKALRPAPDKFDFRGGDAILAFAQAHRQRVRGHNLCWHEALPDWFAATVNKSNAREILERHIQTVAGHYSGKLHSWDVVNEAIDPASTRPDSLRSSPWLDFIGPGYIEIAFRAARKADPSALLTYNDYSIEFDSPEQVKKRDAVLRLVKHLRSRNVPIDAIGVQSHLDAAAGLPGNGLRDFVRELHRMGLQVFVTELDINDKKLPADIAARDASVARIYRDYLTMMLAEPNVTALLTWGITDRYTWLDAPKYGRADALPERPLPFDPNYRPAPAFFAERDAIDSRPVAAPQPAPQPGRE